MALNRREIPRFARNDKRSGVLFAQDVKRVLVENVLEEFGLRTQRGAELLFQRGENPRRKIRQLRFGKRGLATFKLHANE
jgi:hypothetical protein